MKKFTAVLLSVIALTMMFNAGKMYQRGQQVIVPAQPQYMTVAQKRESPQCCISQNNPSVWQTVLSFLGLGN